MNKIWDKISSVLGAGLGIVFILLSFISVPASVIALMHWFNMSWWFATLLVVFVSPLIIIFTIPGLYFWYQADFNVERAINSKYKAESGIERSSKPTNEKELQTMRAALFPKMKHDCIAAFDKKEDWTQMIVRDKESYCYCYAKESLKAITMKEIEYQDKHKTSSKLFDDTIQQVSISCNVE
jgi:hypothetical protein